MLKTFERPRLPPRRSIRKSRPSRAASPLALDVSTSISSLAGSSCSGGDFAESFQLPDGRTAFGVWDAMGHGEPAAAEMTVVRAGFHAMMEADGDLVLTARALNRVLARRAEGGSLWPFVAGFFGVIDRKRRSLRYTACGTDSAMLFHASGDHVHLQPNGPLLGVDEDLAFRQDSIALAAGDLLLVTTDGITEARPSHSRTTFFGAGGVCELYRSRRDDPFFGAASVLAGAVIYSDGTLEDDAAVLVARVS